MTMIINNKPFTLLWWVDKHSYYHYAMMQSIDWGSNDDVDFYTERLDYIENRIDKYYGRK